MIRLIFLIVVLTNFELDLYAQKKESFYDINSFDKVELYVLNKDSCKVAKFFLDTNNEVSDCFILKGELNKSEVTEILLILNKKSTYGNIALSCSTKEFGLLFMKKNIKVGYISLSFKCNNIESDKKIYANEFYKMSSGENGYYIYSSFSKKGRKKLVDSFKKLGVTIL